MNYFSAWRVIRVESTDGHGGQQCTFILRLHFWSFEANARKHVKSRSLSARLRVFHAAAFPAPPDHLFRLQSERRNRKRYILTIFIFSRRYSWLPLQIPHHPVQLQALPHCCALCGGKRRVGCIVRKTSHKCSVCDVYLCLSPDKNVEGNCWTIWHQEHTIHGKRLPPHEGGSNSTAGSSAEQHSCSERGRKSVYR